MPEPIDAPYYTSQARKCRRLAKQADQDTATSLLALAEEYEAKAIELDEKPGVSPSGAPRRSA